jgi:hypothetical protein
VNTYCFEICRSDESDTALDGSVALISNKETDVAARTSENDTARKETTTPNLTAKPNRVRGIGNPFTGGDVVISTEVQYALLVGVVLLGAYAWFKRRIKRLFATRNSKFYL